MAARAKKSQPRRKKTRRKYSEEDRARAIADIGTLGVLGAARKHGVPESCVSRWQRRGAATTENTQSGSAKRHKRAAKKYTPSEKAEVIEHAQAHGVSAASEEFGASRFSIYAWLDRVEKAAKGDGSSPTSGPDPSDIEAQRDREILGEWHKHPGLGPSQIRNQLRRKNVKTSVTTVRRVMEEAGYRPPKTKRHPHDDRFEATRPNHIWHLDYAKTGIMWCQFPPTRP